MVYVVLAGLLVVVLVVFSYRVERDEAGQGIMVNSILLLFSCSLCSLLVLVMVHCFSNYTITFVLVQMREILENVFILNFCLNVMVFPAAKKRLLVVLVEAAIVIWLGYSVLHNSLSIVSSPETGVVLYTKHLSARLAYRWQDVWSVLSHYVFPGIAALYAIVRPSSTSTRLARERLAVNLLALAVIALSHPVFAYASKIAPFFFLLSPYAYLLALLLSWWAVRIHVLLDARSFLVRGLQVLWLHIVPAVLLGAVVALVLGYRESRTALFAAVLLAALAAVFSRTHALPAIFSRRHLAFAAGYEAALEEGLSALDYSLPPQEFGRQVDAVLAGEVKVTGVNILISDGTEFASVYCSASPLRSLPLDCPAFDVMTGTGRLVAFRNQLETHALAPAREGLEELFEASGSQGCILLAEGCRVFGLILLGEKRLGNDYTDYDYAAFTTLYPYFFMVGYYMNSVSNEGIVSTVEREVRMSDQVIRSIQQNMDFIGSPKVDVGYLMRPARHIGGEFIDFIQLTDTRHIVVLGAMSGRGLTASMSMVIMKSAIRTFLMETRDFKELAQRINRFVRLDLPRGTYFAGVLALLDLADSTMYYINCGVPALMLYTRSYNNVIEIQGEGRVLGFVPDISKYLKVKKIGLNPGDLVFACTDGLIDSRSLRGESFGKARIQRSIVDNLGYSADRMLRFTCESLREFTSREQEADITCLVLKILSGKEEAGGTA